MLIYLRLMVVATVSWRADARVIGAVSVAHGSSHFFQLALPPLFPIIRDEFGVGYAELGLLTGLFYAVSGVCQPLAGFAVDRWGARPVLLAGLALLALLTLGAGFAPGYAALIPLAIAGGLGNCVFHPADFSVMNARVSPGRLGRAYGAHGLAGTLGWVLSPAIGVLLTELFNWRTALTLMGAAGLVLAVALAVGGDWLDDRARQRHAGEAPATPLDWRVLFTLPVLLCFAYFAFFSSATVGLQTFSVPAFMDYYGIGHALAAQSLTAYLVGSALGIVVGAVFADRTPKHHVIAATGLASGAAILAVVLLGAVPAPALPAAMAAAGLAVGATNPSRDAIIRRATPPGSSGRVYGFVYSGLDLGSTLAPALFGWFIDHGRPAAVFAVSIVAFAIAILTVLDIGRRAPGAVARAPAE